MKNVGVKKYRLIDYFDVWGNAKEGWEVNNQCVFMDDISITDDATDKDILNYLASEPINFLNTSDMRRVRIEDYADGILEIYEVKGHKPIGCLMEKF